MRFSLIKREPSFFFENMHEDLQRFLKDTFGDIEPSGNAPFERTFRPAVEICEDKEGYSIKVELPCVKKEDITLALTPENVTVTAESKFKNEDEKKDIKYSEFRYGKFSRNIYLEHPVKLDEADSEFKEGVLYINLKKVEPKGEEVKNIEIK